MKLLTSFLLAGIGFLASGAGFDAGTDPFVLGFYSTEPQNDATMELVKATGANYVHSYNAWKGATPTDLPDLAQKHGLMVMYDLGSHNRIGKSEGDDWKAELLKTVRAVKDHPALGIWYLWDEPSTQALPKLKELRQLVKAESNVPSAIVIHERADYWNSRGYSDIWMADNYPVRGEVFPGAPLQWHSRMMRNAAASYNYKGTPFFAVMQACDFSCFKSNVKIAENLNRLRFPNLAEMRFMAFSDLCYGIRGMFFYSLYHCHLDRPAGRQFFHEVLTPVMAEVKKFTQTVPEVWNVTARDSKKIDLANKVSFAYFERAAGSYIILVNDTPETRTLSVNLSEFPAVPRNARLQPWEFTAKTGTLADGVLSVADAAPWECFIWAVRR